MLSETDLYEILLRHQTLLRLLNSYINDPQCLGYPKMFSLILSGKLYRITYQGRHISDEEIHNILYYLSSIPEENIKFTNKNIKVYCDEKKNELGISMI